MELQDYLRSAWRRLPWIAIVAAAVVALGTLSDAPVRFSSQSQVVFSFEKPEGDVGGSDLVDYEAAQLATLATVATSNEVLESVIAELELDQTVADLSKSVSARLVPGTFIIEVSADAGTRETAEGISRSVAASIVTDAPGLLPHIAVSGTQVTAGPVSSTAVAASPVAEILKFAVIGVVLGLGLSVLADTFDPRVRTRRDLRRLSSTVVTATSRDTDDAAALAARVAVQCSDPGRRTILVVPAGQGAAHEALARDLALGYATMSSSTLLVTRDPAAPANGTVVVRGVDEALPTADPVDLTQRIESLRSTYATVVIAVPAAESSQLTMPLAAVADACVVAVEEGRDVRARVTESLEIFREAGSRKVFAVLVPRSRRTR